jgi:hypothetical protein
MIDWFVAPTQTSDATVIGHWCFPEQACGSIHATAASFLAWRQISLLQVHFRKGGVNATLSLKPIPSVRGAEE